MSSNTVALTDRQLKFFEYFKEYQQQYGFFPTSPQAVRDMAARGVKATVPAVEAMMGNLFMKGAFTGGHALSWGNRYRSRATQIPALDISKLNFKAKTASLTNTVQPQRVQPNSNPLAGIDLEKLRALLASL